MCFQCLLGAPDMLFIMYVVCSILFTISLVYSLTSFFIPVYRVSVGVQGSYYFVSGEIGV